MVIDSFGGQERVRVSLYQLYSAAVLDRPRLVFALASVILGVSAYFAQDFRLDVSAESLVLENDADLEYYRSVTNRYGSDDYLIVTYSPESDVFSPHSLERLRKLRDELSKLARVDSVVSLLDVPLLQSPSVKISNLSEALPTLESEDVDVEAAREELITSRLYRNRLMSPDGATTALQIIFARDQTYWDLLNRRHSLKEKKLSASFSSDDQAALARARAEFDRYNEIIMTRQEADIRRIRQILDRYKDDAIIHLGGVPMITADMMGFIRHDIALFGIAVIVILTLTLAFVFRRTRWVVLPFLVAVASSIFSVGVLGLIGWPVTVVSSNFLSLILIFSLSLAVHLIVRYQELARADTGASQRYLVAATMKSKAAPCLYTVLTTMVAFGSLVLSGIRPVIDFGWMMAIALASAFVFAFTLFPAALVLLPREVPREAESLTQLVTSRFARLADDHGKSIIAVSVTILVVCIFGMRLLSVDNRFIDYFHTSTEIYQGMQLIDQKLGGTTPLDVIIDAPEKSGQADVADEAFEDPMLDFFEDDVSDDDAITTRSYWFNTHKLSDVAEIHNYLDSLPDTGKVLSLNTAIGALNDLDDDNILDDFFLSLLYKRLPEDVRGQLLAPYFSEENDQVRFSIRVRESDASLNRQQLIDQIRTHLAGLPILEGSQVSLSGMLILYNNLLQSLFRSQILTLGAVFFAIVVAFAVLFRSFKVAAIAIVPNLLAAGLVLGMMGWLGIPLDIMTITIAAVTIGIAVDDTIHYIHRYHSEWLKSGDYRAAIHRSHASIGRAMYYTTFTITIGFVTLALSDFIPTVYFGLLTGFAMVSALVCDLVVLPVLLAVFKPYGPEQSRAMPTALGAG